MTQEALANEIGMPPGYISVIESGQTDCKASTLDRLAKAVGITISIMTKEVEREE